MAIAVAGGGADPGAGPVSLVDDREVENRFDSILEESLKHRCHRYADSTIRSFKVIFENRVRISTGETLPERVETIRELINNNMEEDLFPGVRLQDRVASIENFVEFFFRSFTIAENKGELDHFFAIAFAGDPCLNGRVGAIQSYFTKYQSEVEIPDDEDLSSKDMFVIYGPMENLFESRKDFTQAEFITYLRRHPEYSSKYQPIVEMTCFSRMFFKVKEAIQAF